MKIYIAGVGVGMGPIAFMARDMGHDVVLSDIVEHDLVEYMRGEGFTVLIGQDGSQIEQENSTAPIEWFIHTAALPPTHPELDYCARNDIRTSKRDDFINELLESKNLKMIAVAGTHGKTNTTGMVSWALQQAGVPISYSVGARMSFGPFGAWQEGSEYFVYEADEFDRNMLKYSPDISIVTNISFDHPDTYADQADYDAAFAQFIDSSRHTYAYLDDVGFESPKLTVLMKDAHEDCVKIPGVYIRQNARLVLEMLENEFGITREKAVEYLNSYPGTSRRMERLAENFYTDYAHHPEEIQATIQAALELNENIVVVYQPHQNIRQHEILDSYGDCFEGAQKVYWLPTYLSRENDLPILSPEQIIAGVSNKEIIEVAKTDEELASKLKEHRASNKLVIGMAAGDLDAWLRSLEGKI